MSGCCARCLLVLLVLVLGMSACHSDQDSNNPDPDADALDASDVNTADAEDTRDAADHTDDADTTDVESDATPDDADAASQDAGDTSSPHAISVCLDPCESPDDCGNDGDPLYNPDHYSCQSGACVFDGCTSDAECEQSLGAAYGCDDSLETPVCVETCTVVDDCTKQDSLNDADNYECDAGFCRFLGCNDDQECVDARGDGYVCVSAQYHPTASVAVCTQSCSSVSDCGSATDLYGEDNYECSGGGCIWTGCNSSEECNGIVDRGLVCR